MKFILCLLLLFSFRWRKEYQSFVILGQFEEKIRTQQVWLLLYFFFSMLWWVVDYPSILHFLDLDLKQIDVARISCKENGSLWFSYFIDLKTDLLNIYFLFRRCIQQWWGNKANQQGAFTKEVHRSAEQYDFSKEQWRW